MHSESFDEIFTYVGKAPKPTPEEEKEREELLKRAKEDIKCQNR